MSCTVRVRTFLLSFFELGSLWALFPSPLALPRPAATNVVPAVPAARPVPPAVVPPAVLPLFPPVLGLLDEPPPPPLGLLDPEVELPALEPPPLGEEDEEDA